MKHYIKYLLALIISVSSAETFAQTVTIKGTLKKANKYTAVLLFKDGSSKTQKLTSSGNFSFSKVKLSSLKDGSLQLIGTDGRYYGPVVLGKKGKKVSISFSGKNNSSGKTLNLRKLTLKSGYAISDGKLNSKIYTTPKVKSDSKGKPIGAGSSGLTSSVNRNALLNYALNVRAAANPGVDTDNDGVPNSVDVDDNNNGILDSADPASAGSDTPYQSIVFDFRKTLNANVREGLSSSAIDAVVSGENVFASTFFISLPQNSNVDGGYLICGDSLTYCRRNTPLAFSGGVSESSDAFRGPMNTILTSDGYPKLEKISVGGFPAVVLSMQPRVGRDVFRPGDLYRVVLTSNGREVSSRTFSLPPYFVSIPALKEYTANGSTTTVDYSAVTPESGSIPGVSPGSPIILGSNGLLTVTFWRPQREPLGSETGYQDFGGLNYGAVIETQQATCAGLYTGISTDLVEDSSALGTGNSPLANQGANLHPLVDQVTDRPTSSSNTLTFTVDLKTCLSRSGGTPGTYAVDLSASGSDLTGGANKATQLIYVTIP